MLPALCRVATFGWLRLRDAFDEVIRRHMRTGARGAGAFTGPGEMAIVTVKFLRQHVKVREKADQEIRQRGLVRVLWIIDSQGMTFGTANGAGDAVFGGIPILQQRISWFKFIGGNFQARTVDAGAIVQFRRDSRIFQSPLENFAI